MKKYLAILLITASCSSIRPTEYAGRYKPTDEKQLKEIPSPIFMIVGTITLFMILPK